MSVVQAVRRRREGRRAKDATKSVAREVILHISYFIAGGAVARGAALGEMSPFGASFCAAIPFSCLPTGVLGTAAIKVFDLEMGRTGLSETEAQRLGIPVKTKMVSTQDHPAYYPNPSKLVIKLIYDARTRRLLGANTAGTHDAVMRTDIFAVAIHAGMTTEELGMVDLAYAPPFASVWDAVHIAANAAK